MNLHANARTCPKSRRLLVERVLVEGRSVTEAAEAAGVSDRTARKWVARFKEQGEEGLFDRSSAPKRIPHKLPRRRVEAIRALRKLRMTAGEIAEALGLALSTVSCWLKRIGLGKRSRLEPPEPPNRYERRRPGELLHLDIKKLGRVLAAGHRVTGTRASQKKTRRQGRLTGVAGWEFVHVCVDDHTRLAYAEVLPDQTAKTAVAFLRRALDWFAERGVHAQRLLTDNGSCYRKTFHGIARAELGLKHTYTRPYRPRTNGKAERFIQTMLNEWAYGQIYGSSRERTSQLKRWLTHYNYRRPHGSLGHQPPATRLNNLVRNYN
jgi:transposase InsO family protein